MSGFREKNAEYLNGTDVDNAIRFEFSYDNAPRTIVGYLRRIEHGRDEITVDVSPLIPFAGVRDTTSFPLELDHAVAVADRFEPGRLGLDKILGR